MPRLRTGSVINREGVLYARISYKDETGWLRRKEKRAENKTHANKLLNAMLRQLDDYGPQLLDSERMKFSQLATYYENHYLVEPRYIDGRKVAGMRSYRQFKSLLKALKAHFGKKQLRSISYSDLEHYRAIRLDTPTKRKGQRSISSVNRELSLLRKVFHVAIRNGWMIKNPVELGRALITPGDEKPRERILTRAEEDRLLAACIGKRKHLRPIIIMALDTGMRAGEILKLKWADIDFENQLIAVRAFNTKTMRERSVGLTPRLEMELQALFHSGEYAPDDLVFGIRDNVKRAFVSVRKEAGLNDVRFHDLRHTNATRLIQGRIPLSEVGRILGHTQAQTTFRYINANVETAHRAAAALHEFNNAEQDAERATIN